MGDPRLAWARTHNSTYRFVMEFIGIDLGTTNSVIVHRKANGDVVILQDPIGEKLVPSVVSFTSTNRVFGSSAKNVMESAEQGNTVFASKRFLGRLCNEPGMEEYMEILPYKVMNVNNRPMIVVEYLQEKRQFEPVQISAMILEHLRDCAESILGPVKGADITVQAYFSEEQCRLTRLAAKFARLNVLSIMNEPTAAALAYGLQSSRKKRIVLVIDIGGGTFDVNVLKVDAETNVKVLACGGHKHLGGEDFDMRLFRYYADQFQVRQGCNLSDDLVAMQRLRQALSKQKHQLSDKHVKTVTVKVPNIIGNKTLNVQVTQNKF